MLFNSLVFLAFASFFFLFWHRVNTQRARRLAFIVTMSSVFYGWWNWGFLVLIFATGLVDFVAAQLIETHPRHKKKLLVFSLSMNLGTLGVFKYSGFLAINLNWLLSPFSLHVPVAEFVLPIGISFYTFQSMSYAIDVYRGHCKATRDALHFYSSLLLFPQLVAGPILRAGEILPQLETVPSTTEQQRWDGMKLIAQGYFKKMVIADNLAPAVTTAFGAPHIAHSGLFWWVIITMFAFQIYCDFSGYTDIARGLAKWMGYEFRLNFDRPYAASSLREFWERWHISLSTWFRDYVYIPLGGSRKGTFRSHLNMWITMLLSGLWHGANWKFIAWGALHASYLSAEKLTSWPARIARFPGGGALATLLVLVQVWIAWVFFRAESASQAVEILAMMFRLPPGEHPSLRPAVYFLALAIAYELAMWSLARTGARESRHERREASMWLEPAGVALLVVASIFLRGPGHAFIYFQF